MSIIADAINSLNEDQRTREIKAFEHFISFYITRYPQCFISNDNTHVLLHLSITTIFPTGTVVYLNKKINSNLCLSLPSLDATTLCKILENSGATNVLCTHLSTLEAEITATLPAKFLTKSTL